MLDSGCSMLDDNLILTILSRIQRPVSSINALTHKNYKSFAARVKVEYSQLDWNGGIME
jgi:hypothetical protein